LVPEFGFEAEAELQPKLNDMKVYAGRLLARREYGVRELQARLLKKWSGFENIDERVIGLIDSLVADDVLSDERFVLMFVRSRLNRNQGPMKIRSELQQKQVPKTIVEACLQENSEAWGPSASAWLSRQVSGSLDFSMRAKYYRRLMNRGFSHQQAMDAVNAK
jgi:regulatory protein